MRNTILCCLLLTLGAACRHAAPDDSAAIIALERAALDRWGRGDPQGFADLMAGDITYFDPTVEKRVNGAAQMKALSDPLQGKIRIARYDMIEPKVQQSGDMAVLSYNLISYGPQDAVLARWNSTEVYRRTDGSWKVVHNHWSLTRPELKTPIAE